MKGDQVVSKRATCPYYHKHDGCRIFCAGVSGAMTTMQFYETAKQRKIHMARYCEHNWDKCGVAYLNQLENEK